MSMLKVLHIITSLRMGGAEKLLLNSLSLYQEQNVSVDLLVLSSEKTEIYKQLITNFKGKIYLSPVKNRFSPKQIFFIKQHISLYNIVHVHLFPALYWTLLAKGTNVSPALIFTEHSTENRRLKNYLFRQLDKIIYKSYSKIIAITPAVKETLIKKLKIDHKKIQVVYNGINIQKYSSATKYCKSDFFDGDDAKVLIQISSFQAAKDQKTVIKSMLLLPQYYKLLLVGDGNLRGVMEALVEELCLKDRVNFLGIRMDVENLLKTADVVIQSSHWEGFGLAAVEGMAAEKPVLASNVKGLAEVVQDAGLVFEKGNEKDLAQKIMSLENNRFYNEVSQKCYNRALQFDISVMIKEYVDIYHSLLK